MEATNAITVPVQKSALQAAYALNMCAVSVSQIVDYNDAYILDQEYDAILNNLNIEAIPKDQALLNILTEILNTVTAFKIQEIKKQQIEKNYQKRVKSAIWSAIPSFSVIATGDPVGILTSVVTQVGTGYMNYRRERDNVMTEKEKAEVELNIAAIEQFNALRRELFTTAWKLADAYNFPDNYRLTEKQISQYNQILMDPDDGRRYYRLKAISNKFEAYPPFWYFYAHTAMLIADKTSNEEVKAEYLRYAEEAFNKYQDLNSFNILREDQIAASADLEYAELLLSSGCENYDDIAHLIDDAVQKSGNANDVLQMCAVSYLRIGKSEKATIVLQNLVNEKYNTTINAKILSRLYVSLYSVSRSTEALTGYSFLKERLDHLLLFPMPSDIGNETDSELDEEFLSRQKNILVKEYRCAIDLFAKKQAIEFNSVIPAPYELNVSREEYYSNSISARRMRRQNVEKILDSKRAYDYLDELSTCGFQYGLIDVLNDTVAKVEQLDCFKNLSDHDDIIHYIEGRLRLSKASFSDLKIKLDTNNFSLEDYDKLTEEYGYRYFTENFFDKLKTKISESIDSVKDFSLLENMDSNLSDFCQYNELPAPEEYLHIFKEVADNHINSKSFDYGLICNDSVNDDNLPTVDEVKDVIKKNIESIDKDKKKTCIFVKGEDEFETYFKINNLQSLKVSNGSPYLIRQRAVAIVDGRANKDYDLILCTDGIRPLRKNSIGDCVRYNEIHYVKIGNAEMLKFDTFRGYKNENIDIAGFDNLIKKLSVLEGE